MSTEILIIDDNSDIRNIINDLIIDSGYKTRLAANYNQALKEIDKKLPDVAIIDVKLDKDIEINFNYKDNEVIFNCDNEQLSRVFLNLIKNSIESIQEKYIDNRNFNRKIDIEISNKSDYIEFSIIDNGKGFINYNDNLKNILNPYFTTKQKGTGLGLAIVNKIINDHNGTIDFIPLDDGAKVKINFIKNVN